MPSHAHRPLPELQWLEQLIERGGPHLHTREVRRIDMPGGPQPAALDTPLGSADPQALANAAALCQAELDAITQQESLTARIQRSLLAASSTLPTLQTTARLLHMAPRTLHRRLGEEGSSFRIIKEALRHRLALQHLRTPHLSLQEIAYRLGYTDPANFRRAFKRWQRQSPSAYRAEQQAL